MLSKTAKQELYETYQVFRLRFNKFPLHSAWQRLTAPKCNVQSVAKKESKTSENKGKNVPLSINIHVRIRIPSFIFIFLIFIFLKQNIIRTSHL